MGVGWMPRKNSIKEYAEDTYYHVYNRGVNKRRIFLDDEDYTVFLSLLKRYLSPAKEPDKYGRDYPSYHGLIELNAYCLMPNHFHLLVYQKDDLGGMQSLMRSVATSYSGYFNKKYKRVGTLFEGRYKASRITSDPYLLHISRYIHMNPKEYWAWPYSSWPYYTAGWSADWVQQHRIFELFEGGDYAKFVGEYVDTKEERDQIKRQMADK